MAIKNGYGICLNEWALDKEIKSELGLLLIISSLCAKNGVCVAGNDYLSELFKVDNVSISRKVKKLEKLNYISIDYDRDGAKITKRKIRLTKTLTAINKNVKGNSIITPPLKKGGSDVDYNTFYKKYCNEIMNDTQKLNDLNRINKISLDSEVNKNTIRKYLVLFLSQLNVSQTKHENIGQFTSHFSNWIRKQEIKNVINVKNNVHNLYQNDK